MPQTLTANCYRALDPELRTLLSPAPLAPTDDPAEYESLLRRLGEAYGARDLGDWISIQNACTCVWLARKFQLARDHLIEREVERATVRLARARWQADVLAALLARHRARADAAQRQRDLDLYRHAGGLVSHINGAEYWLEIAAAELGIDLASRLEKVDPEEARATAMKAAATELAPLTDVIDRQTTRAEHYLFGIQKRRLTAARIAHLRSILIEGNPAPPEPAALEPNRDGHQPGLDHEPGLEDAA